MSFPTHRSAANMPGAIMPFESLKARLMMILEQAVHQPDDAYDAFETIREEIETMRGEGLTPPDDLVELEAKLAKELARPES